MSVVITTSEDLNLAAKPAAAVPKPEDKKEENLAEESEDEEQEVVESENEESEEESKDDESEESEDVEEKDDKKEEVKPKKKGGFQKRIDRFKKQLTAKEQELEYWKNQAMVKKEEKPQVQEESKADDLQKPKAEAFETNAEYLEALADWKADQKLKAFEEKQSKERMKSDYQKQQLTVAEKYQEREKEFAKTVEDYEDVLEEVSDFKPSIGLQECLLTSELGPQLAYNLAKNREELERINALSPLAQAREIGKLEAKLAKPEKEIKKQTKAPPPINPIGSKSSASVKKDINDPNLSQAEYEALRRKQMAKKA